MTEQSSKLSAILKRHGYNISPSQAQDLLIQREILSKVQNVVIKDKYQLVVNLLKDFNVYYRNWEVRELFFEPPMY